MSPPTPLRAGTPAVVCKPEDLNPIDLKPFKHFPTPDQLDKRTQKQDFVKMFYANIGTALVVDTKFGDKNEKLESGEVDTFLKANAEAAQIFGDTCSFMKGIRAFAENADQIKAEFFKGPDLSPLDLSLFKALPYLDLFPELQTSDLGNNKIIVNKVNASSIPDPFKKKMLENQQLLFQYYMAKAYLKSDVDGDGNFSIEDAKQILIKNGNTTVDPKEFLLQAKDAATPIAMIGFTLREENNLEPPTGLLDIKAITILAQFAPEFTRANPDLLAFIASGFPQDPKTGDMTPSPEVQDGIITLAEFKKFPGIQKYLKDNNKIAEDVLKSLQSVGPLMKLPVSFWPKEPKENFEKLSKTARDQFENFQGLSIEMQQMDWAIRMMQAESASKFDQEANLDHPDKHKDHLFLNAITYVFSGGKTTAGEYFHETRPTEHRETRNNAIDTLVQIVRENHFTKIEEAITYMTTHSKNAELQVLNAECHLGTWVEKSNIVNNVDRNREVAKLSEEFRVGEYKFWEFPIFPSPRLGSGGWWNRASHAKNWTLKSPEIIEALALDEYIAYETPNNFMFKHAPDITLLVAQLPEEQQKAFGEIIQSIEKGEAVDSAELTRVTTAPNLSKEGQAELLTQVKLEMVKAQNIKLLQDPTFKQELDKIPADKKAEASQLLDTVISLFMDPKNPLDPEKLRKVIEAQNSRASKAVAKYIADVDVSKEKQVVNAVQERKLPESFKTALFGLMDKMKKVEGESKLTPALDTLLREAQLANPTRARELFELENPTEAEKVEFQGMVFASKLSRKNQLALMSVFFIQPNNIIAERAEKHFMAIMGDVEPDPTLPDPKNVPVDQRFNRAYTGNLHSDIRTTLNQSIGLAAYAAPTLIGGSAGHALSRSILNYSRIPIEEINGLRRWVIPGRQLHRLGILGGSFGKPGLAGRFFGNPWVGTAIGSALGAAFTISPYGDSLRDFAHNGIRYPYFHWSDMAVMDMPNEGVSLYLDANASFQGVDAVLGTAKTFGTL